MIPLLGSFAYGDGALAGASARARNVKRGNAAGSTHGTDPHTITWLEKDEPADEG